MTTGLAVALYVGGADLADVLEEPIRGRYADLRGRCDHPSAECSVLHRALANSVAAAGRLRDLIREGRPFPAAPPAPAAAPAAAPRVALADVGYEVDALPAHLAGAVAAAAGCAVTNLGTRVPAAVLGGAAGPAAAGYPVGLRRRGGRADAAAVAAALAAAAACESAGGTLLVHGDAIPPDAPGRRIASLPDFAAWLSQNASDRLF